VYVFFHLVQTEQSLEMLVKFENIGGRQLDVAARYAKIFTLYGHELEQVRHIYQTDKGNPTIPRNLPPIAGRITWARQLFRRIETPMKVFKKKPELLKVNE
jgi:dynein heavy chain